MKTELLNISEQEYTIQKAVSYLLNGEVIALPTETVYGLAVDLSNEEAVKKLYEIKKRSYNKPLSAAISNISDIKKITKYIPMDFYLLAEAFLPGPLSIILPKNDSVSNLVSGDTNSLCIRVTQSEITNLIINHFKNPIAMTSANISGYKPCIDTNCVYNVFHNKISAIIDGGKCKFENESTIISLISEKPKIIREGAIPKIYIEKVLGYEIL